jgi:hypothetical protein
MSWRADLFTRWSTKSSVLSNSLRRTWRNGDLRTQVLASSVDETWAYGQEGIAFSAELGCALRVNKVQRGLGYSVGHRSGISGGLDEFGVTASGRNVNNLLLGSPLNQGEEHISNGDRPNDIGLVLFPGVRRELSQV